MKSYFPDINVWIALSHEGHEHHIPAARWFDRLDGNLHFCRITQLGFLRLLTHPTVMRESVRTQKQAWEIYDSLTRDPRVVFVSEPDSLELENAFRRLTSSNRASAGQWPDAYLAAFAEASGLVLVTFDRGLRRFAPGTVLLG
jgi:toxin-antitoxin system PIN domain toxin